MVIWGLSLDLNVSIKIAVKCSRMGPVQFLQDLAVSAIHLHIDWLSFIGDWGDVIGVIFCSVEDCKAIVGLNGILAILRWNGLGRLFGEVAGPGQGKKSSYLPENSVPSPGFAVRFPAAPL
ncbi:hypothetical protein TNCT_679491 [Trichonephila clavata]|uniref:Uncharacterized protein n=1 Tax=Trichonephila clavata TaxID=2740835 RepID=A0A8X6KQY8_TRICU|nr:hypothetical protein TNCT_679491 [Trichonephila clavata]